MTAIRFIIYTPFLDKKKKMAGPTDCINGGTEFCLSHRDSSLDCVDKLVDTERVRAAGPNRLSQGQHQRKYMINKNLGRV